MEDFKIEIDDKTYQLKYSIGRLEKIEQSIKKPLMASLSNNGLLSISELKIATGMAMIEDGAASYVAPQKGIELVDRLIQTEGYSKVLQIAIACMQRDCPFFFQAD